jgi:glycosyltransferase involved in cell wall biosynthesis
MQDSSILSIILAVKDAEPKMLKRCFGAIAGLRHSSCISLTVVSSGSLPEVFSVFSGDLGNIEVINMEPKGIYSAYNRGLDAELGRYVLFLGVDDIILPGLDDVLETMISSTEAPDIIACRAFVQDRRLSGRPSRLRGSLVFRSWCQQGLLYRATLFAERRFDIKYVVQADHKFNIEVVGKKGSVVDYRLDTICYFSKGGITNQQTDLEFRRDMPAIVKASYGRLFWILALARRWLANVIKGDPAKGER